jgi:hypothetical protein
MRPNANTATCGVAIVLGLVLTPAITHAQASVESDALACRECLSAPNVQCGYQQNYRYLRPITDGPCPGSAVM